MGVYAVLRQDLPEVTRRDNRLLVDSEILHVLGSDSWKAEDHRRRGLAELAIAEYLDNLKPKLPTELGSVIYSSKFQNWTPQKGGVYLHLECSGLWATLDSSIRAIAPQDIEEWVPVKLVPQIEVTP